MVLYDWIRFFTQFYEVVNKFFKSEITRLIITTMIIYNYSQIFFQYLIKSSLTYCSMTLNIYVCVDLSFLLIFFCWFFDSLTLKYLAIKEYVYLQFRIIEINETIMLQFFVNDSLLPHMNLDSDQPIIAHLTGTYKKFLQERRWVVFMG